MDKQRVWIIAKYATPNKYPRHFGIGKYFVTRGIETTLFVSVSNSAALNDVPKFRGWSKTEYHDGLKVVWMNGPIVSNSGFKRIFSWLWFEFKVLLSTLFSKSGPNAVIVSSLSLLSVWSGLILSKRYQSKFIFEVRDIWPLSLIELTGLPKGSFVTKFLGYTEKLGYKHADTIIGTMPNLKEHVSNVSPSCAGKVECIPQGVYLEIFGKLSEPLDKEYIEKYIPKNKFIVAYTGTLNANNPIDTLFDAARQLSTHRPDVHFLILGEGVNKEKYKKESKDLLNVTFPPIVKKQQMSHFLSYVDVGYDSFSSTLAKYGLSRNKWIDYMYNECIIICSYNGFKSMINEADSGLFVAYGNVFELVNAIEVICDMPVDNRNAMKGRAKKFIEENRTFDKLGSKFFSLLDLH